MQGNEHKWEYERSRGQRASIKAQYWRPLHQCYTQAGSPQSSSPAADTSTRPKLTIRMMIKGLIIFVLIVGTVLADHSVAGPVCGECEVNIHGVCKRTRSCITENTGQHEGLFAVLKQKKQHQDELAAAARTP